MKTLLGFIYVGILGAVVYFCFQLVKNFKTTFPGVSEWWLNFFGKLKPGTQIPDPTGSAGAKTTKVAFDAVANRQSQGFYDAALQQFAYDNDFATALSAQGSTNWKWGSYSSWVNSGMPHLQGEEAVSVDDHGVWHNDYM